MSTNAAKRTRQPLGTCKRTGKLCFLSEQSATATLGRLRSNRSRRGHMETRAYLCTDCDRWHLTSWSSSDDAPTKAPEATPTLNLTDLLAADLAAEVAQALAVPAPVRIPSPAEVASHAHARRSHAVPVPA